MGQELKHQRGEVSLRAEGHQASLMKMEEQIARQAASLLSASMDFAEVTGEEEVDMRFFEEKYGMDGERAYRLAKYGLMPLRNAPSALVMAQKLFGSVVKAAATREGSPVFNAQAVFIAIGPGPAYEEQVLDMESEEGSE